MLASDRFEIFHTRHTAPPLPSTPPRQNPLTRRRVTNILTQMHPLATLFTTILAALRVAVATHVHRHPVQAPLLNLACTYISRTAQRLARLIAHWQAGTLPPLRPAQPGRESRPITTPRLPTARTWLVAQVGYTAAGRGSQLQYLLATPECAAFLREVPRAGRLLRPLARMLGLNPIPEIALPPRPPRPRHALAPRPPEPSSTPDRPLPAYVRAAVRAWRRKPA